MACFFDIKMDQENDNRTHSGRANGERDHSRHANAIAYDAINKRDQGMIFILY